MNSRPGPLEIERQILRLCEVRGAGKSICPSEVARALAQDEAEWRALMPVILAHAADLTRRGRIRVLQAGRVVDPERTKGPIRLASVPDER